jgi:hypothetical protein
MIVPMLALIATTACGGASGAHEVRIDCATAVGANLSPDCRSERDASGYLVIRHADGGFRRFRILNDGQEIAGVDGAEPAKISVDDDHRVSIAVGDDRYRLPANIAVDAKAEGR